MIEEGLRASGGDSGSMAPRVCTGATRERPLPCVLDTFDPVSQTLRCGLQVPYKSTWNHKRWTSAGMLVGNLRLAGY